jgi:vitamin B12 transporter
LSLLLFLILAAQAQEIPIYKTPPVVITSGIFREAQADTVVELPTNAGSKAVTLDDAIRGVPGVVVARSGGVGQPSSLFLRGASSEHTLVLVDGVQVNDPSHPTGGFDFSTIDLNLVEKIEVFKGPQTLRFGPGAVGGVVNIITKKGGAGKNILAARVGDYQTNQLTARRLGRGYSISVSRFETAGISASAGHPERDGHRHWAGAFRLTQQASDDTEFEMISRATTSFSDLDYATGPGFSMVADDPNYHVRTVGLVNAIKGSTQWNPSVKSNFTISHFYLQRVYDNRPDADNPETFHDARYANSTKFENTNSWAVNPHLTVAAGPSARVERAKGSAWMAGAFADANYSWRRFFIQGGLRGDKHENFGERLTHAFAPGFRITDSTTVVVREATAFKPPSLYQLHDVTFGNSNLKPELVRGLEGTVEQLIGENIALKATGFRYRYTDLIQFTTRYDNVASATVKGGEFEYSQKLGMFEIQGAYTYTAARNDQTNARLVRRPFNSWRAGLGASVTDYLSVRAEYRGVGSRRDQDAISAAPNTVSSYEVADVSAAVTFTKNLQVTVSLENALDRKYQEVSGYGTPGLGLYFGLRAEL